MFKRWVLNWKQKQDTKRDQEIYRLLHKYYFSNRRKDFLVKVMLDVDFTIEDYEELSNLFGQHAHDKGRGL